MFWTIFTELCSSKNTSASAVAKELGLSNSTTTKWKKGSTPSGTVLKKVADYFGVSVDSLLGDGSPAVNKKPPEIISNADIISDGKNIYMIPLFENVSAGFGAVADDHIIGYIPMYFTSQAEADESIFITVRGDSMYPKIENGDSVLVHKQSIVDSGTIAVVLLDEEDALVKRIVYGDEWIELQSINPMYPPMRFEGAEMLRIQILGAVKKIIKSV